MKYPDVFPAIAAIEHETPSTQTFKCTGPSACDASNPAVTKSESPGSIGKSSPVSMKMMIGIPIIPTAVISVEGSRSAWRKSAKLCMLNNTKL